MLIEKAEYTEKKVLEILKMEFPEYKIGTHVATLSELKDPRYHIKYGKSKKMAVVDPMTNILSFG